MNRSLKFIPTASVLVIVVAMFLANFLRGQNHYPAPAELAAATPYASTFFDPDPQHPWNQLYGLLFIRPAWNGEVYGQDQWDPLYWRTTHYLLQEPVHAKALAALDQFIASDAGHLIKDPLKRAVLQHMLWVLFDHWSAHGYESEERDTGNLDPQRREFEVRLVKIMKSVALTEDEINALPNNYQREVDAKTYAPAFDPAHVDAPFLPATFFAHGDWVELGTSRYGLLAVVHTKALSGRSNFHVLLSAPTGRSDTLAYLKKLHDFQPRWIYDPEKRNTFVDGASGPPYTNPDIPQVPLLTKFALVRTANLIDDKGEIVASPLVESVQIRVIRSILPNYSTGGDQSFLFFELDPAQLLQGKGGLVAKGKNDLSFDMVLGTYSDPMQERSRRIQNSDFHGEFSRVSSCFACHSRPGLFSMNSYIQFFQDKQSLHPPDLQEGSGWSTNWKDDQYDWGLLQAYWFAQ